MCCTKCAFSTWRIRTHRKIWKGWNWNFQGFTAQWSVTYCRWVGVTRAPSCALALRAALVLFLLYIICLLPRGDCSVYACFPRRMPALRHSIEKIRQSWDHLSEAKCHMSCKACSKERFYPLVAASFSLDGMYVWVQPRVTSANVNNQTYITIGLS